MIKFAYIKKKQYFCGRFLNLIGSKPKNNLLLRTKRLKIMFNIRFEALKRAWEHEPVLVENSTLRASVVFAQKVFTREKMQEYIASNILEELFDLMDNEKTLSRDIANSVAIGM